MRLARENTENGEVILRQGPAGYEIIVDGQFLMSSASSRSSVALVELGLVRLGNRNALQVLIGGLGLGFSFPQLERNLQQVFGNVAVAEAVDHNGEGKKFWLIFIFVNSRSNQVFIMRGERLDASF